MSGLKPESSFLRSSISLSIVAHLLFFLLCAVLISQRTAQTPIRRTTFIDLEPIPQDLLKKSRAREESKPNERIVQTTKSQKTDKAAPDAFLGEQTQVVDRQTVSKDRMIQMGDSKSTTAKQDAKTKTRTDKTQEKMTAKASPAPLQSLGLPMLPTAKQMDEIAKLREKGEDRSDRLAQGEQAPKDYVQGLKEGETTALNTREFMFFGYYQRIRERLDRAWVPILRKQIDTLYRRGRYLASEMDYSTKVLVVMNGGGEIIKVQVMTESGAQDLDDAAIKAFNMAGPFPNPPKGIADHNGEIRIPWEFILRT
jgi:protein TonB